MSALRVDENPTQDDPDATICALGVILMGTLLACLFGGLGFVLCAGWERCVPSIIGQVMLFLIFLLLRRLAEISAARKYEK